MDSAVGGEPLPASVDPDGMAQRFGQLVREAEVKVVDRMAGRLCIRCLELSPWRTHAGKDRGGKVTRNSADGHI